MSTQHRTLLVRMALLLAAVFFAWFFFSSRESVSLEGSATSISYSKMLDYIDRDQISSATFNPTSGLLLAVLVPTKDAEVPAAAPARSSSAAQVSVPASSASSSAPAVGRSAQKALDYVKDHTGLSPLGMRSVKTIMPPDDTDSLKKLGLAADLTVKGPQGSSWGMTLFLGFGPILLMVGLFWWLMRRQSGAGPGQAMSFGKSKVQAVDPANNKVRFGDVAGCDEAKAEVSEVVEFLKNPHQYARVGGKMPHGLLLSGPPGTGKTLLAKAIAGEANVPFFFTSGSDFVEMFVGVGASRVRDTFAQAKAMAPSIIFIDEIDAVGRHRSSGTGGGGNDEREQTLNALLVEMDGFKGSEGVIVIAATNRADMLDEALRRPGRFDREVAVGLPDRLGRAQILAVHARQVTVDAAVDWDVIARGTPGFSGAELASLINEAALAAARAGQTVVTMANLEWARDRVMMGAEKISGLKNEKERRITAYHEAGHALVARFVEGADPVHKITIVPRGRSLGLTMQLPQEDASNYDREDMLTRLAVLMGGRAAEDVALGLRTAGASNDFARAASLARKMVSSWGMDDDIGPISFDGEQGVPPGYDNGWSESWKRQVDDTVSRLLRDQYQRARLILLERRETLEVVGKALLEEETLDAARFEELVSGSLVVKPQVPPALESGSSGSIVLDFK